jgi:Skp family chaperone for outer membrane proteins
MFPLQQLVCKTAALFFVMLLVSGCSSAYYSAMEKVGIHKRDILVDRVEGARDAQTEAQEQFKSALEQFASVVDLKETDLKKAYKKLNEEYISCEESSKEVSERIGKVEMVSEDLFEEWEEELELYDNKSLQEKSKEQLNQTKDRYRDMLISMRAAEKTMKPVLHTFHDNVLFLKHNLNAQAIGSLRAEFSGLKDNIDILITKMNASIAESNAFIAQMENK